MGGDAQLAAGRNFLGQFTSPHDTIMQIKLYIYCLMHLLLVCVVLCNEYFVVVVSKNE